MSDLRKRIAVLEKRNDPKACIECECRRMNGGPEECPAGLSCRNPGRSWCDYFMELNEKEHAHAAQS